MKLGEMLVREGHLTRQQVAQALRVQGLLGNRLGTTLLEEGLITEASLLEALGRQRSTRTVSQEELAGVPAEVVRMIPARLAERCGVVPFHLKGRTLFVASKDVGDFLREDEIGFLTSCMVRTCIAPEFRIHEALERYYRIDCPDRHKALVRRFVLRQGNGSKPAQRPAPTPPAQQPATPDPRPPQTVRRAEAPPVAMPPRSPGQRSPATREKQPATPTSAVRTRPAAAVTPPSFVELDEEDAALLGTSSSDSLPPSSDEPVILEPAPLPWLSHKSELADLEAPMDGQAPAHAQTSADVQAEVHVQRPTPTIVHTDGSPSAPAGPIAPAEEPVSEAPGDAEGTLDLEGQLHRAAANLRDVEIRDDIADVLLAFCEPHFQRRVILVTRKENIVGWRGEGEGIEQDRVREIEIPARDPSVFLGLTAAESFWLGSLPALPANQALVDGLGGELPKDCVVLPVILRSRVVCYLYGDNLTDGVAGAPVAELRRLVAKAGMAFEIYILKNKLRLL